jgi:hypothetical protein
MKHAKIALLISETSQRRTGVRVNATRVCRTPNAHSTSFQTASCKAEQARCAALGLDTQGTDCTKHRRERHIPSANTYPKLCPTLSIQYSTFGGHLPAIIALLRGEDSRTLISFQLPGFPKNRGLKAPSVIDRCFQNNSGRPLATLILTSPCSWAVFPVNRHTIKFYQYNPGNDATQIAG